MCVGLVESLCALHVVRMCGDRQGTMRRFRGKGEAKERVEGERKKLHLFIICRKKKTADKREDEYKNVALIIKVFGKEILEQSEIRVECHHEKRMAMRRMVRETKTKDARAQVKKEK